MSKIIRTRKPSVLPYYAAALAFVVLCAVLPCLLYTSDAADEL